MKVQTHNNQIGVIQHIFEYKFSKLAVLKTDLGNEMLVKLKCLNLLSDSEDEIEFVGGMRFHNQLKHQLSWRSYPNMDDVDNSEMLLEIVNQIFQFEISKLKS